VAAPREVGRSVGALIRDWHGPVVAFGLKRRPPPKQGSSTPELIHS
jgi:hypothetical protein